MVTTAVFDLETSDLSADSGIILCGVIKSSEQKKEIIFRSDELNKDWAKGRRGNDKETTKRILDVLKNHDVLVAHNGTRFDLPFLRTRALRWGLDPLKEVKIVDPLSLAWRKLRLKSNRLGSLQDYLGVGVKKTPLDMSLWMRAILDGDAEAMDAIVHHCVMDVRVLEGVFNVVKPYVRILDDRGSAL